MFFFLLVIGELTELSALFFMSMGPVFTNRKMVVQPHIPVIGIPISLLIDDCQLVAVPLDLLLVSILFVFLVLLFLVLFLLVFFPLFFDLF